LVLHLHRKPVLVPAGYIQTIQPAKQTFRWLAKKNPARLAKRGISWEEFVGSSVSLLPEVFLCKIPQCSK